MQSGEYKIRYTQNMLPKDSDLYPTDLVEEGGCNNPNR
jgi:hypothetical protein